MSQSGAAGDFRTQLFAPPVPIGAQTTHLQNKTMNDTSPSDAEDLVIDPLIDWRRPALKPLDPQTDSIAIQQLETDFYIQGEPAPTAQRTTSTATSPPSSLDDDMDDELDYPTRSTDVVPGSAPSDGQREAVIRIFGITLDGNSICMHIHGFRPYFYIPAWDNMTPAQLHELTNALNHKLVNETRERGLEKAILDAQVFPLCSIWGYQQNTKQPFIRFTLALPTLIPPAKRFLEEGILVGYNRRSFTTYETNIPYVLRFMVDMSMGGGNWAEAPAGSYTIRKPHEMGTLSQLEIDLNCNDLISHQPEGKWLQMAPMRVLSFDIECAGRKGFFPTPDQDSVIQIASVLSLSTEVDKPIRKVIHTLNTCSPIPGAELICNETEVGLLKSWQQFFLELDPDIIIGYNIINFDLPYLIDRAKHLKVSSFPYFSRVKGTPSRVRNTVFSSRAIGKQENKEINMEGRIQFDLLVALRRDYKLVSYTLNAVSAHFLKQQKEDVHHSMITDLQNGDDETRRRLAEYCLKDALLPMRLMQKLLFWINYVEMARVTGVPIMYLLQRGQSIKVISQILRKARQHNMVVPALRRQASDDKYEGATVLDPITGYYPHPIATLDFASLYPSIMMAHNLCYTTLVSKAEADRLGKENVTFTPHNDYFVKQNLRKGLLPEILEELLKARTLARKEMALATDPMLKAVLNGRQLALKISANSVYGFTGAQIGQLPCLAISSSVTAFGREMIEHTKAVVEREYTKANGYEHDAVIVYGDTDSVMIKFGTDDLKEAMRLGLEASERVSREFIKPIKLEFEKVYYPFLLMNKKRYAGLYWTNTTKYDKIDAKGIETVRRDNCMLVRNVVLEALETILLKRSPQQAVENVKKHVSDLLTNKVDLSLLVISKALGKGSGSEDYSARMAHVELAERMRKRDPTSAPNVGDRVPYVIIKGARGAPAYERSEDPLYVLEHKLPIDTDYYLENQLKKPLERIFIPILGDQAVNMLFKGEHTRHIKQTSNISGSIFKFAVKTETCVGCRVQLPDNQKTLCSKCEPRRAELYMEKMEEVRENEEVFSRLWSECQRCQGSVHQEVLCENRDCPIFYRRKKVQIDLDDTVTALDRFNL